MTLANELREVTDEVIMKRIEAANLKILNEMWDTARAGDHYVIYPSIELSTSFLVYLEKQGLRLFGRYDGDGAWHRIYTAENIFSTFNKIMIAW
jgi:hypothetical protein